MVLCRRLLKGRRWSVSRVDYLHKIVHVFWVKILATQNLKVQPIYKFRKIHGSDVSPDWKSCSISQNRVKLKDTTVSCTQSYIAFLTSTPLSSSSPSSPHKTPTSTPTCSPTASPASSTARKCRSLRLGSTKMIVEDVVAPTHSSQVLLPIPLPAAHLQYWAVLVLFERPQEPLGRLLLDVELYLGVIGVLWLEGLQSPIYAHVVQNNTCPYEPRRLQGLHLDHTRAILSQASEMEKYNNERQH